MTAVPIAEAGVRSIEGTVSANGAAIATEGVTRMFGGRAAVSDLALTVERGCTYGLIGLNGAGKSTTIKMLVGLLPPSTGTVRLRGIDVWQRPVEAKLGVGYVPDQCVVHAWMRVGEAIAFCRALQPNWSDGECATLAKKYRLDMNQKVGKLSKGTAAKLSLLLALSHNPDVLILDEPTDGLDPVARDDFLESVLACACERDRTVLMSSHSLGDVQRMADRIGLMHNGKLVIQCATEDLVRTTKRVRLVAPSNGPMRMPEGANCDRRDGRERVVTVRGFHRGVVEHLTAYEGVSLIAVEDVTLDDIFKDFVRGQEVHE